MRGNIILGSFYKMHLNKLSNILRQNEEKIFKKEKCTYSFLSIVDN